MLREVTAMGGCGRRLRPGLSAGGVRRTASRVNLRVGVQVDSRRCFSGNVGGEVSVLSASNREADQRSHCGSLVCLLRLSARSRRHLNYRAVRSPHAVTRESRHSILSRLPAVGPDRSRLLSSCLGDSKAGILPRNDASIALRLKTDILCGS